MKIRYAALLGRRVDVLYRTGEICLPASGVLVGDSGKSIFLEERIVRRGRDCTFRWEIPYHQILRLRESFAPAPETAAPADALPAPDAPRQEKPAGPRPLPHKVSS